MVQGLRLQPRSAPAKLTPRFLFIDKWTRPTKGKVAPWAPQFKRGGQAGTNAAGGRTEVPPQGGAPRRVQRP